MNKLQVEVVKLHKAARKVIHKRVENVTEVTIDMTFSSTHGNYINVWAWEGVNILASALCVRASSPKQVKREVARLLKPNT